MPPDRLCGFCVFHSCVHGYHQSASFGRSEIDQYTRRAKRIIVPSLRPRQGRLDGPARWRRELSEENAQPSGFEPRGIDFIPLTHAHPGSLRRAREITPLYTIDQAFATMSFFGRRARYEIGVHLAPGIVARKSHRGGAGHHRSRGQQALVRCRAPRDERRCRYTAPRFSFVDNPLSAQT
jgi:hypothetical protein